MPPRTPAKKSAPPIVRHRRRLRRPLRVHTSIEKKTMETTAAHAHSINVLPAFVARMRIRAIVTAMASMVDLTSFISSLCRPEGTAPSRTARPDRAQPVTKDTRRL